MFRRINRAKENLSPVNRGKPSRLPDLRAVVDHAGFYPWMLTALNGGAAMNLLSRIAELLDSALDDSPNEPGGVPEVLADILEDMKQCLDDVRRITVAALIRQRRLVRNLKTQRTQADLWRRRARAASACGDEVLTRRALSRQKEHEEMLTQLQAEHAGAMQTADGYKDLLRDLEGRYERAKLRQCTILELAHATVFANGERLTESSAWAQRFQQLERELAALDQEFRGELP